MSEWWQVGVAIYAAIVATGALFLEVRRWFERKPRLSISAAPGMKTFNIPGTEKNEYLLVTVANRGAAPTTLTTLALVEYVNWWARIRDKPSKAAVVANPSIPGTTSGQLPHVLAAGERWMGAVLEDKELRQWISTKRLYVTVYASHSDAATLKLLRLPPTLQSLGGAKGAIPNSA